MRLSTVGRYALRAMVDLACQEGEVPVPRLLYTQDELRELRKLQVIAKAEQVELRKQEGKQ